MDIRRALAHRWRTWVLLGCAACVYALFVIRPWAQEPAAGWELLVQIAAVLTAGLALFALFVPAAPRGMARREESARER
ncbi:hypothetical protein [Brevibacterium luteolum]|uniref:Uncharacterized protein n=1 Tax=Brevibacterium luteolum TaxID=199591 RepID=A0A6G8KZF8_9MICO|nr:hypothetical protein [Brevibacterium luteolum]QIN29890.1 hypothetical protein EW640_11870 [Brevibacterium luteolum]